MEEKTAALSVRVTPTLKQAVERAAAEDHRTVASLLEKMLTDHMKQGGYLDPPAVSAALKKKPPAPSATKAPARAKR
jgi:hypothetical protein